MKAYDNNGMIDYAAIEREAHRLRNQAAAELLSSLRGWMARHRLARNTLRARTA